MPCGVCPYPWRGVAGLAKPRAPRRKIPGGPCGGVRLVGALSLVAPPSRRQRRPPAVVLVAAACPRGGRGRPSALRAGGLPSPAPGARRRHQCLSPPALAAGRGRGKVRWPRPKAASRWCLSACGRFVFSFSFVVGSSLVCPLRGVAARWRCAAPPLARRGWGLGVVRGKGYTNAGTHAPFASVMFLPLPLPLPLRFVVAPNTYFNVNRVLVRHKVFFGRKFFPHLPSFSPRKKNHVASNSQPSVWPTQKKRGKTSTPIPSST